uniref:Uncharacterized protein n=1 Tax=Sarcoptes scabiei TaxID=52283 RepID=A0A834R2Z0_SARSC
MLLSIAQFISSLLFRFGVLIIKCYVSFYMLSSCHEILEDHREGTVNARSKSINLLISTLMLSLTFIGLYGVFTTHFGLFLTWILLKPVIRIMDIESPLLHTVALNNSDDKKSSNFSDLRAPI